MNLRAIDLNLLVALEALISERHVTRAADRVGLSQPAMSSALGRLRHIFKDDLLVRTARGMQPTPRALELMQPLGRVLRQVERVLEGDPGFDPAASRRAFRLRLSDLLAFLLLPGLLERLKHEAPQVALDVVHLPPARTVEALENDEIDLAVSMGLAPSGAIRSAVLFADRMVCVMRRGHRLARRKLTLDAFLAERHVKTSMSPADLRFVDDALKKMRRERDVALNLPHWHVVPRAGPQRLSRRHAGAVRDGCRREGAGRACAAVRHRAVRLARLLAPAPRPQQADPVAARPHHRGRGGARVVYCQWPGMKAQPPPRASQWPGTQMAAGRGRSI